MSGRIVVGYQGIGKSSLAGVGNGYIDLESGNFWVDGQRNKDWYIIYCNIANHLAQQGYTVFTSSHEVVRKQLYNYDVEKIIVYPSIELKDKWIEKLQARYDKTKTDKDYKALMNAVDRYEDNIRELMNEHNFDHVVITDMNYILYNLLSE